MSNEKTPLISGQGQGYSSVPYSAQYQPYPSSGASPYPPAGAAPYPPAGAALYPPAGATPYPPAGTTSYFPAGATSYPHGQPAGVVPSYQDEMPHEDVKDDPSLQAPVASAPALEQLGYVEGYENVGFQSVPILPPSYEEVTRYQPPEDRRPVENVPTIKAEQARQALLQHVSENCCYGKGAAQEMTIRDLKPSSAFHYTLETFTEARSTSWAYQPYTGQPVDGSQNGPAPGPWDIQASPPALFTYNKREIEVPHTASVKPCHNCFARGYTRCYRCHGRGRLRCEFCHGKGRRPCASADGMRQDSCSPCDGTGRRRCYTCFGRGQIECSVCGTQGSIRCYIKLTIVWTNHCKDHIVERTALPDHLIRNVSGKVAFEEQQPRVWPISQFPEQEINVASNALIGEHSRAFPAERILMQRHQLRIVPVMQVIYTWKDKQDSYFVYGFEHRVHAPDYPQQCCCGCSIL